MSYLRFGAALGVCAIVLAALHAGSSAAASRALPAYQVDLSQTTVSGLSSGAFMAEQFAVAYSGIVQGAGIVAGGPYYCASYPGTPPFVPYLHNAMSVCMNPQDTGTEPPDAAVLWNSTREFAREGVIDDVANLQRQRIYLFSGRRDETVTTPVVDQTRRFYELAGTTALRFVNDVDAGHGLLTDNRQDNSCALTAPPFFNNCGRRQAQEILDFVYGGLNPPAAHPAGHMIAFDQEEYAGRVPSMASTAYAFVPAACESQTCRVHIAFHGCRQSVGAVGDHFYAHAGYNEMADTNRIIVLYPQVEPSYFYPYNPKGCWDFWGYSASDPFAPNFYSRQAPQMAAVRAMLARLAQPRETAQR